MMGVRPEYRDRGIGFSLKRAQWQMVRNQGLDRITWTYDPLLSRNAHLNIARLGAVCNTYMRSVYGELRDDINAGIPSDRFQVDWWVNSARVSRRLSRRARRTLDLAHFLAAGAPVLNPSHIGASGLPQPGKYHSGGTGEGDPDEALPAILLVEIPADFPALKEASHELALEWRLHTRSICEDLFERGYLVTDFVYLPGTMPRSFYVLSHGESTL
jgi:predicted GNAT superfamily acetyltransferase